ncbi:uncharacterized protein LOC141626417 [Silene latifolia]|uniref:uncharacterized protein LOC141626417 n=1 Tax=Silene latifolia TaxID=37657 RepID=UPI003D770EE2
MSSGNTPVSSISLLDRKRKQVASVSSGPSPRKRPSLPAEMEPVSTHVPIEVAPLATVAPRPPLPNTSTVIRLSKGYGSSGVPLWPHMEQFLLPAAVHSLGNTPLPAVLDEAHGRTLQVLQDGMFLLRVVARFKGEVNNLNVNLGKVEADLALARRENVAA